VPTAFSFVAFLGDDLGRLHDLGGQPFLEERIGTVGLEPHREVVHDLDALDLGVVAPGHHLLGRVEHAVEGGLDVPGRERRAIVKLDARTELHLPGGLVDRLPRGGQARADGPGLEVARGQVVEHLIAEDDGFAQHRRRRIPGVHVGLEGVDDGIVLGLGEGVRDQAESEGHGA
jgi:hypothetical protein